jgi:type II secretory pathway component PulJ
MSFRKGAFSEGFSLVDVILGITFFSVFFSMLFFGFSTLVKRQQKVKEEVYSVIEETDRLSETYYIPARMILATAFHSWNLLSR